MIEQSEDRASATVRRRYNRVARTYDLEQSLVERLGANRWRRELWARAPSTGTILEIGVGTGASMRYYPGDAKVHAIDVSEEMLRRAESRARKLGIDNADLVQMDAQQLQFDDGTFDAVLATFVFCSVPDPVAGLREAGRVLKPGASLFLLEHVRSPNPVLGRMMDLVNPIAVRMSGANMNRKTVENIQRAGFEIASLESHAFGIVKVIEARWSA